MMASVGPVPAIRAVLKDYATFTGRSPRSEFWWFTGIGVILSAPVYTFGYTWDLGWYALADIVLVATLLPTYAVLVRRLHDAGHSGKWLWIILTGVGLLVLLLFALLPSHPKGDAYGPAPTNDPSVLHAPSAYPPLRTVPASRAAGLRVLVWSGMALFFASTYLPQVSDGVISQRWADVVLFGSATVVIAGLMWLRDVPLTPRLANRPRWSTDA